MIAIRKVLMKHSGGTKFYQIYEFTTQSGKTVTLTHRKKVVVYRSFRPVDGGQTSISHGGHLLEKRNEKICQDYSEGVVESLQFEVDSSWWIQTFGAALSFELKLALGLTAAPSPINEPHNTDKPDEIESIEPRPESWGSW